MWLETIQRVFYHGTQLEYDKPKLDGLGIYWLAFDPKTAMEYATKYYIQGKPKIWTIVLNPRAKIIDFRDLSNPIIREIKESVSRKRESTTGHPINDAQWASWADFGVIESNPGLIKFLRSKRIDGLVVKDNNGRADHDSVALFNLRAIAQAQITS